MGTKLRGAAEKPCAERRRQKRRRDREWWKSQRIVNEVPNSAFESWYSMNHGAKWRIECKVGGRNEGIHEGRNKKRPGELANISRIEYINNME